MPIFGQTTSNCDQIVEREQIERNAAGLSWREGLWTPCAAHGSSAPPLWDLGSSWHRGLRVLALFLPSCQVAVVKIFSAGRKYKKIKVNFAPKGPRIWRRHLWIHHFCKVWYSGKFAINLMTKACTPDFRHLGPGPHDEEVGCQEHLPALIGDRLHIQHNLLRGGPR